MPADRDDDDSDRKRAEVAGVLALYCIVFLLLTICTAVLLRELWTY